jgi:hypothetical protein
MSAITSCAAVHGLQRIKQRARTFCSCLCLTPAALPGLDWPKGFAKAVISMAALVPALHAVRTRVLLIPAAMAQRYLAPMHSREETDADEDGCYD